MPSRGSLAGVYTFASVTYSLPTTAGGKTLVNAGFTLAQLTAADVAYISVETSNLRYFTDETIPNTTNGHLVVAGQRFEIWLNQNIVNALLIAIGSAATIQITLGRLGGPPVP